MESLTLCSPTISSSGKIYNYIDVDYREEMEKSVRFSLTQPQKFIHSRYLYDAAGSRLFDRITRMEEYYPTATEISILENHGRDVASFFDGKGGDLVELGSGSPTKVRRILDEAGSTVLSGLRYIPMDICEACLIGSLEELERFYPDLRTFGLLADFSRHMNVLPKGRKTIMFLGSTIGNFPREECGEFLLNMRRIMNPGDRFIIGMDMLKPVPVIEAAYNDREGITREFNLNVLKHINRRLNADFKLDDFEHRAFFNEREEQIEMHLRAVRASRVEVPDARLTLEFREGETIRTEICRKFSRKKVDEMVRQAGFSVREWYTDPKEWFSLVEIETARRP